MENKPVTDGVEEQKSILNLYMSGVITATEADELSERLYFLVYKTEEELK